MIELVIGRPGQGKSYYLAFTAKQLLNRALWIKKKHKKKRDVYTNFHIHVPKKFQEHHKYFNSPIELIGLRDIDIIWDELGYYFPSDQWKNTDEEVRRFFAQHRKRGIEIYANTQAYMNVDINVRRMLEKVKEIRKVIGSRNPSATKPDIKFIWGVFMIRKIDITKLEEEKEYVYTHVIPEFIWMTPNIIKMFDTEEDIKMSGFPTRLVRHVQNKCFHCDYIKVSHT